MKKLNIIPQENSVLIKRAVVEKQTTVGFIIPEAVGEAQALIIGIMVTMGTDKPFMFKTSYGEEIPIYNNQKILFEKNRGTPVYVDGEEYIFLDKRFIVAIYNEDED